MASGESARRRRGLPAQSGDARSLDARQDLAGLWVTGIGKDGKPRSTYLYHVVDNAMVDGRIRAPVCGWQTAINPVVALELWQTEPGAAGRARA